MRWPGEAISGNDGTIPGNDATIPGDDGAIPWSGGVIPGNEMAIPRNSAVIPGSGDTILKSAGSIPKSSAGIGQPELAFSGPAGAARRRGHFRRRGRRRYPGRCRYRGRSGQDAGQDAGQEGHGPESIRLGKVCLSGSAPDFFQSDPPGRCLMVGPGKSKGPVCGLAPAGEGVASYLPLARFFFSPVAA